MKMTREEAKDYVRSQIVSYLETVKLLDLGENKKKKFKCLNPAHDDHNPSMNYDPKKINVYCPSCETGYDTLDLISMDYGLHTYNEALDKACEIYHIEITDSSSRSSSYRQKTTPKTHQPPQIPQPAPEEPETDYTEYFKECAARLSETDYHRGISETTLKRFNVGYDPAWKHPKADDYIQPSPRLIIPTSKYSYIARDTRKVLSEKQDRNKKLKAGRVRIFNLEALDKDEPVFIVEGEIDALSIIDVGKNAIGLGSIANVKLFFRSLDERPKNPEKKKPPIIVSLDNEMSATVQEARTKLMEGLKERGYRTYTKDNLYGEYETKNEKGEVVKQPYKDANDALNADREAFTAKLAEAEADQEREVLKKESAANSLQGFINRVIANRKEPSISTGFDSLDKILNGGLHAGLYFVGAVTSLGKTTFCLQIADHIAAAGHDVLVFSLEMATDELIAKSVSRLTYIRARKEYADEETAKRIARTTSSILDGDFYGEEQESLVQRCIAAYGQSSSSNLYISEGVGDIGVEEIREDVERHKRLLGQAPVVIIDYIQILAPYIDPKAPNRSMTDKQNTDKNVLELKRLSRDHKIPIIGISSFNRDNYTEPVNLAAFKESGAIEYSSDVLLGLQYEGMDYQEDEDGETAEKQKDRESRVRKLLKRVAKDGKEGRTQRIQVKILKNRNGSRGSIELDFCPKFNYFEEPRTPEDQDNGLKPIESSYGRKKKN